MSGPWRRAAVAANGYSMDRLDSLLPTAPVVWSLLVLFVGSG
ncbi:hypothetical protein [Streptomyces niveiscabiei]|uniref:Uncharacterized protein n=1 Tax=Streptomyces niveiscabiei TaxID=164115 RepID=A0ABW9HN36_9ACTN